MDGYKIALEFDTATPDFVRGVEIGRLWEILTRTPGPVAEIIHASNAEMVQHLAERIGRAVRSEELDGTWILVAFDAAREPTRSGRRARFRAQE